MTVKNGFGDEVLAMPTSKFHIVRAREFDRERGMDFVLMNTRNGNQWTSLQAISRDEMIALRDSMTRILEDR